ncbi:MAG: hypothetical protein KAH31_00285 [Candidatus Sabulitectum sp.]|nr:hypothetical protein [Candidatus Sabulitectum sp.]
MNKIVVHMKNGEIAKGHTNDFSPQNAKFHLTSVNDSACKEEIKLDNLKAVFFVKDFRGNFLHTDSHDFSEAKVSGKHIVVSFYDGEMLFGISDTVHRNRTGFFLFPVDPEANTERAFVINSFIESVNMVE